MYAPQMPRLVSEFSGFLDAVVVWCSNACRGAVGKGATETLEVNIVDTIRRAKNQTGRPFNTGTGRANDSCLHYIHTAVCLRAQTLGPSLNYRTDTPSKGWAHLRATSPDGATLTGHFQQGPTPSTPPPFEQLPPIHQVFLPMLSRLSRPSVARPARR